MYLLDKQLEVTALTRKHSKQCWQSRCSPENTNCLHIHTAAHNSLVFRTSNPHCTFSNLSALLHLVAWSIRVLAGKLAKTTKPGGICERHSFIMPLCIQKQWLIILLMWNKLSLTLRVPLPEFRETFLIKYTPPCSPAILFSGKRTIQSFPLPVSGYVMAFCYRLLYSETCLNQCFSVFIEFFVTFFWHYIIFLFDLSLYDHIKI